MGTEIPFLQSGLSSLCYALFNVPLKKNLSTHSRGEQLRYPCHIQMDTLTKYLFPFPASNCWTKQKKKKITLCIRVCISYLKRTKLQFLCETSTQDRRDYKISAKTRREEKRIDGWRQSSKLLLQAGSYHEELKPLTSAKLEGTHLFSGNICLIIVFLLPTRQRGFYYLNFLSVGRLDFPD